MIEKRWYAIHTYSGMEQKAKQNVEYKIALEGFKDEVDEVMIPSETVVEIKNGKKKNVSRPIMPGYVFINMSPNNELFALISKLTGVANFVGDGRAPIPLSQAEVNKMLGMVEEKSEKIVPEIKYTVGDQIRVASGPFANFVGMIEKIDPDKGKLTVSVSIFGRATPVELDAMQVETT